MNLNKLKHQVFSVWFNLYKRFFKKKKKKKNVIKLLFFFFFFFFNSSIFEFLFLFLFRPPDSNILKIFS